MRSNSDQKRYVIIAFAIIAVGLAVFSIMRTLSANQGRAVGSLGDLSGGRGAAAAPGVEAPKVGGGGKAAEQRGGDAASGAPPEAARGGP